LSYSPRKVKIKFLDFNYGQRERLRYRDRDRDKEENGGKKQRKQNPKLLVSNFSTELKQIF
jgi:hypothetical protein